MEKIFRLCEEAVNEADDYRELSDRDRKILIQRFINQIIYDKQKFKIAVKLLEKWESYSSQQIKQY